MTGPAAWLASHEAICLTAVTGPGVDVPTLCTRLGHDPALLHDHRSADAWDLQDGEDGWREVMTFIEVGRDRVLLVEENGFGGSDPRALELLSRDALAVCAYWNVNWTNRYSVAANGTLLGTLEHTQLEDDEIAPDLTHDRSLIAGRTDEADGWKAGYLAALEHRAGFRLNRAWFEREHPTLVVPSLLPPPPKRPTGMLWSQDEPLWQAVKSADERGRCRAFAIAARACAAYAGVDDNPSLSSVIATVEASGPSETLHRRALEVAAPLTRDMTGKPVPSNPAWRRLQAGAAISALMQHVIDYPFPMEESEAQQGRWDGLAHAANALGEAWPDVRKRVLRGLDVDAR